MTLLREQKQIIREIKRLHARRAPLNISAVKRSHPRLIARVYAVRPFWGWKRALEDAGLDYGKINTELLDYIDCKICGGDFGALPVHLLRKHDVTVEDYRDEYPDEPTTCETGRATLARRREHKRLLLPRWEEIWTPEYILDRMAELHRRNLPLHADWASTHDPALTGNARIYFGSWDAALRRIGLDPKLIRRARPTEHLTAEQLIARLKKRRKEGLALGEKEDSPLANAAVKYFGSWTAALRAAGIEPAGEKSHWPRADKAAIVAEIRRRKRAGESLRHKEVGEGKWGRALQMRCDALFGSWPAAILAAGLDLPAGANSPWPKANKAAIVAEIHRRKRKGETLQTTILQREKWGGPLLIRSKILFGSWSAAILAAGVDLPAGMMTPWARAAKGAVLAEIRRRDQAGESLRYTEVAARRWGGPIVKRGVALFGSWTSALLAAGVALPAELNSPWSKADKAAILTEIRRRKRAGESLRYGHIDGEKWGKPLLRRGKILFGDWTSAVLAAGFAPPAGAMSPWPQADGAVVLAEIRRRKRAGESLRSTEVQRESWGKPLHRRATTLFGSWPAALRAAGIEPIAEKRSPWVKADEAAILAEIRRRKAARASVRSIATGQWGWALRRRATTLFGSWSAALLAAGVDPPAGAYSPWPTADEAAVLAEIRGRKSAGESLLVRNLAREQWGNALRHRAKTLFGSWNSALLAAGVDLSPGLKSVWVRADKATILAELHRRKRARESLRSREIPREKWGAPLLARAKALFGSWSEALLAAGVALPAGARSPWPKADEAALLAEIRRRQRAGESLLVTKLARERWGRPLLDRAKTLFDSWPGALRAAGIAAAPTQFRNHRKQS